ncbi:NADH-quinone oxidoreductase subunit NuoN [Uliginosibacterium sp. 31-12]|uniref:NADH-quinone oxidoreductase subunit NuoN n=1 Tax=Uliginosibacterium sp. 31-12 TaxID=3062781 RepID=UPI0026E2AD51|nr:NADH-quinone oxidoreductase subunit NuoN [Uliginosibacterium sp. 31-12]MDO6386826.1 NADH-quinone oxidoreductase subunit NuoN [Uliginosibacterium sp. 31-12]
MDFQIPNFVPLIPELILAGMGLVILLAVAFSRCYANTIAYYLTQASLISAMAGVVMVSSELDVTFGQMYLYSPLGDLLKVATCVAVGLGLLYGRRYMQDRKIESGEYYLLVLFATLGVMVLISAGSLLTVYVGLEMLSLSSYALVAVNRDSVRSTEAAMKYFVLGALASGLLLYGMSMVYGATQSLGLIEIGRALFEQQAANRTILLFGLVFLVAGVSFKLGVVPFHMWMPDVYEGAPTPVTQFIATASKLAAFAMACRLFAFGLWDLMDHWKQMLLIVGIASIVLGNIAAIAQNNIKRMLAYSGISHMGFMLLGFVSSTTANPHHAYASSLFYVLTYALTTLAAFGIINLMSRAGFESENLEDLRGLNKRSSWWAAMMAVVMFSMAGIPFFVGFFAKFFVLQAFWQAGYAVLAVVAVLMSLIGAYYYLRVVKIMFFDEPTITDALPATRFTRIVLSGNVLMLAALGLFPSLLMQICVVVMQASL